MWKQIQSLKKELGRINARFFRNECMEDGYKGVYARGIREEINTLRQTLKPGKSTPFIERYKKEWEQQIREILPDNHEFLGWSGVSPVTTMGRIRLDSEWRSLYWRGLISINSNFILSAQFITCNEGIYQHQVTIAGRSLFVKTRYLYSCGKVGALSASAHKREFTKFYKHLVKLAIG